jgi:hypothetical protein
VDVITGNAGGATRIALSSHSGAWERLAGRNGSCPANVTMIVSGSDNGADFDIDTVTIVPRPGTCGQ